MRYTKRNGYDILKKKSKILNSKIGCISFSPTLTGNRGILQLKAAGDTHYAIKNIIHLKI